MKVNAILLITAALTRPLYEDYMYDLSQYEADAAEYDDQDYSAGYDEEYDEDYDADYSDYFDQDYTQYYDDARIPSYGASRLSVGRVSPAAYEAIHNGEASGAGASRAGVPAVALLADGNAALAAATRSVVQASELAARAAENRARGRADTIDRLSGAHMRMANTAMGAAASGLAMAASTPITPAGPLPNPAAALAIGRGNHLANVVGDAHMAARLRDAANRARAAAPKTAAAPSATRPRSNTVSRPAPRRQ
jgi:hypothetical protein